MHHFAQSIQNTKGDALTGYYVKAVDPDTGSVVSIYADESLTPIVSVSGVANAALVDDDGMASFWIDDGTYHLDIYGSDSTTFIRRIESLPMGIASPLLESISDLTFGANNYIYGTADNTAAAGTITAFGRSLVDDADAATARTTLGATTVGSALVTLTNPSAITFLRVNADNSVTALNASDFRTAIGAGVGGGDLLAANNLSDLANAATAATNLGLGTGSSPQFTGIELGHASDTTLTRVSAGVVAIEGTNIVKAGAATGSGLTMATSRLLGRTTASSGAIEEISIGSNLSFSGGTLNAGPGTGSAGWGLAGSWTWSTNVTNVDINNLGSYSEFIVLARNITTASATFRVIRVSVDNGSTFYSASGDYVFVGTASSAEGNATEISGTATSTTAANTVYSRIYNNLNGYPKMSSNNAGNMVMFVGSTSPINAIRLTTLAGVNITGGSLIILGR